MSVGGACPSPDLIVPEMKLADGVGPSPSSRKKMPEAEAEGNGPPPLATLEEGSDGESFKTTWCLRLRYPPTPVLTEEGGRCWYLAATQPRKDGSTTD